MVHRFAVGFVACSLLACTPPTQVAKDAGAPAPASSAASASSASSAASASSVPRVSPLARLVPPARPGPRSTAVLTIEPGVGFGPVLLGETVEALERAGLKVTNKSDHHAEVVLAGTTETLKLSLCDGKVIDIWIDDLRKTTAPVMFGKDTFARTMPREDLEKALGGCTATAPRIGGAFERCQDGGVYVGHGLGDFVQLRVRPKTFPFDNTCFVVTDDGSPIALSASEREALLRAALNLPQLGSYWHVTKPGRDPLRIVRNKEVPELDFMMFGSQVVWIDDKDATAGSAFLRVTSVTAQKSKATLSFEYPVEGVVGAATFTRFDEKSAWRLESSDVHER